jgi:hypothetical protein
MLGKAKPPLRTIRDNASAMLHNMYVPNSMCSCAVNVVVCLRNRTFIRAVGVSGGVPLTMLTTTTPGASKFSVFGCIVFAKVHAMLRRKMGDKAFRGVMIGYPPDASWYHVDFHVTRRVTTLVHVVFQEDTPRFSTSTPIDSA